MAKARVELRSALSHTARGRQFKKGAPQILTNPADILFYQQQSEFSVTLLEEDKPAPVAPAKVKAAPAPKEPEPEEPVDENEEELKDADEPEEDAPPAAPAKGKPAPKGPTKKKFT